MAVDPVCKMEVNENDAAGNSQFQGHSYYFCSPACKDEFDRNPSRFASEAQQALQTGPDIRPQAGRDMSTERRDKGQVMGQQTPAAGGQGEFQKTREEKTGRKKYGT